MHVWHKAICFTHFTIASLGLVFKPNFSHLPRNYHAPSRKMYTIDIGQWLYSVYIIARII